MPDCAPALKPEPQSSCEGSDLRSRFGERLDILRFSLTDACNQRCPYCQQEDSGLRPRHHVLTDDEILRLIGLFAGLGFREIRFTGDPTLRSSVVDIVRATACIPGVRAVSLTTNGDQLVELAQPLKQAGLSQIYLAIDPFVSPGGTRPTRCTGIQDVRGAIEAAAGAGLRLKIISGVCRDLYERGDLLELARLTLRHAWDVRFLEQAPLPPAGRRSMFQPVPREMILARLAARLGPLQWQPSSDPAAGHGVFRVAGAKGTLAFVDSRVNPADAHCNYLRLTAEGDLRLCLVRDDEVQLRMLMHGGASDEELRRVIRRAVESQPWARIASGQAFPGACALQDGA